MAKKSTTKAKARPKVGVSKSGRTAARTEKVGSRTYTFYSGKGVAPLKKKSARPKASTLGTGAAAKAAKLLSDRRKAQRKRLKAITGK